MAVAGLLLVGGESRRLGTDKASLVLGGMTLTERGEHALRSATSPVVVVDRRLAADGPLAAVAAGWAEARRQARAAGANLSGAVVLAVDMPFVPVAFLRWLANQLESVVPVVGGRDQPLAARYDASLLDRAEVLVATGERAMRALVAAGPVRRAGPEELAGLAPPDCFVDIDTGADFAAARARLRDPASSADG